MSCKSSVTTATGTFTAYPEIATKCEAEQLCKERGQILAPFTNDVDMRTVIQMFNDNHKNGCSKFHSNQLISYRIGLNFEKAAGGFVPKMFSNEVAWEDKKYERLYNYKRLSRRKLACPVAAFHPFYKRYEDGDLFQIYEDFKGCEYPQRHGYMCLQPVNQAEPLEAADKVEPVLNKDGCIFLAVFVAFVFACFAVFFQRKSKKYHDENVQLKAHLVQNIYE